MAAAIAPITELRKICGPDVMAQSGARLPHGLAEHLSALGLTTNQTGFLHVPFSTFAHNRGTGSHHSLGQ